MKHYKYSREAAAASFDYDQELQFSPNIAMNIFAAILHKAHTRRCITYWTGMKFEDFYTSNEPFLSAFIAAFKEKKLYDLNYAILRQGINDFIDRMEFIDGVR